MTVEKGSLKDWDDRHYQSIDDLPPEAWDAVRDRSLSRNNDIIEMSSIIEHELSYGKSPYQLAVSLYNSGFKRD